MKGHWVSVLALGAAGVFPLACSEQVPEEARLRPAHTEQTEHPSLLGDEQRVGSEMGAIDDIFGEPAFADPPYEEGLEPVAGRKPGAGAAEGPPPRLKPPENGAEATARMDEIERHIEALAERGQTRQASALEEKLKSVREAIARLERRGAKPEPEAIQRAYGQILELERALGEVDAKQ